MAGNFFFFFTFVNDFTNKQLICLISIQGGGKDMVEEEDDGG